MAAPPIRAFSDEKVLQHIRCVIYSDWDAQLNHREYHRRSMARRLVFFLRMVDPIVAESFFAHHRASSLSLMYQAISNAKKRLALTRFENPPALLHVNEVVEALSFFRGDKLQELLALDDEKFVAAIRAELAGRCARSKPSQRFIVEESETSSESPMLTPEPRAPIPARELTPEVVETPSPRSSPQIPPAHIRSDQEELRNYIRANPSIEFSEESWRLIFFAVMLSQPVANLYYRSHGCQSFQDMSAVATCAFLFAWPFWPQVRPLFSLEEICYVLEHCSSSERTLMKRWFLEDRFLTSLQTHFDLIYNNFSAVDDSHGAARQPENQTPLSSEPKDADPCHGEIASFASLSELPAEDPFSSEVDRWFCP